MAHYLFFQLLIFLISASTIFPQVSSQLLWGKSLTEPEERRSTSRNSFGTPTTTEYNSPSRSSYMERRQRILLEVCLAMKDIYGTDEPSEFYLQLLCGIDFKTKLGGRRTKYPLNINEDMDADRSDYMDGLTGRSQFPFGGSHTNKGGKSWNPQLSSVQNLKMSQQGEEYNLNSDFESDEAEPWTALTGRSKNQVGGGHVNNGGVSYNPQLSIVRNVNMKDGDEKKSPDKQSGDGKKFSQDGKVPTGGNQQAPADKQSGDGKKISQDINIYLDRPAESGRPPPYPQGGYGGYYPPHPPPYGQPHIIYVTQPTTEKPTKGPKRIKGSIEGNFGHPNLKPVKIKFDFHFRKRLTNSTGEGYTQDEEVADPQEEEIEKN